MIKDSSETTGERHTPSSSANATPTNGYAYNRRPARPTTATSSSAPIAPRAVDATDS